MLSSSCTRVLLAGVVVALLTPFAAARKWVGADGVAFEARYVRTSGDSIVVVQGGKTLVLDKRRLSEQDRAWVGYAEKCSERREWKTSRGETIRGRFERLDGDTVFIRTRAGRRTAPLAELIEADRRLITGFQEIPMVAGVTPAEAAAAEEPTGLEAGERIWTSNDGSKIVAKYLGLERDKVVLFYKNREWRVGRDRFCEADQRFLDARPRKAGVVMFDELDPEDPVDEADAFVDPLDRLAGGFEDDDVDTDDGLERGKSYRVQNTHGRQRVWVDDKEVFGAEAQRIAALVKKRNKRLAADLGGEHQRVLDEHKRLFDDHKRRHEQAVASLDARREVERERKYTSSSNTPERREAVESRPRVERSSPPPTPVVHEYECYSCDKTFTSPRELGVGDHCPHCGVTFDQLTDENGEVVAESSTSKARRYGGITKAVIFGVMGFASLIGWLSRRM